MTLVFARFAAALLAACCPLGALAAPDMALLRVSGSSQPTEFNCPASKSRALANAPRSGPVAEDPPASLVGAYTAPDHNHTPGLKIGLWGDSHTASGTFTDKLLEALRLPRAQTHPSFIAPTFGLKGIRHPLRRACLSDDWQLSLAFRSAHESPQAYAKSLAHLGTDNPGAYLWLDFRYPDAQTRLKWADIHFSKDQAERTLVLGIRVDDGAEAIVNLGPGSPQRLRVQGEQAFMTWDFLFRMRSKPELEQCIRGATHLHFAADGRVKVHRDYWDAAEELYEKIPLLGGLMRWLKRSARK